MGFMRPGERTEVIAKAIIRVGVGGALASVAAIALGSPPAALADVRAGTGPAKTITGVAPGIHVARGSDVAAAREPPSRLPRPAARSSEPSPVPRIVGGQNATIANWPWQTSIAIHSSFAPQESALTRHICGGALVTPTIAISAAHCFVHEGEFVPPGVFEAITGRTRLTSGAGQVHELVDYYLFVDSSGRPLYDPGTGEWDVLFLELTPAASSSPIRIAGPGEAPAWAPGRDAHISGWGATTEDGSGSDLLQQALIEMIADSVCASAEVYGDVFRPSVMVCAGILAGGVDACQGDSGGPLVVPIGGGTHRLAGITSWGVGCAQPNRPGVYARIADDPIRSALGAGIEDVAGIDVVGPARPARLGPALRATVSPRQARATPGRARAWRVRVRNDGNRPARRVRVCVRGPKRKITIRGRSCRPLAAIAPEEARTRRFRVRVRPQAGGRFVLRFRVRAANHPAFAERARARISR